MREAAALLLAMVLLVAGCLSEPSGDGNEPGHDEGDDAFAPRALYLAADGTLVDEAPTEQSRVGLGDFAFKWTTGDGEHPRFHKPLNATELQWLAPQNATVTLYLSTQRPVLPAREVLPDVAVWTGSGHHMPLVGSKQLEGPLMPDEIVEVTFPLPGPKRQPDILTLAGISLLVTVTMTQHDAHEVHVLTGGENASHVTLETRNVTTNERGSLAVSDASARRIEGTLPLFDRVVDAAPQEGINFDTHAIDIAPDQRVLLVHVEATGGGHTVDMDMQLLDPQGRPVTWGVTPYPREVLWLAGDNLEPYRGETLTLRIANHLGIQMEYEGAIESA